MTLFGRHKFNGEPRLATTRLKAFTTGMGFFSQIEQRETVVTAACADAALRTQTVAMCSAFTYIRTATALWQSVQCPMERSPSGRNEPSVLACIEPENDARPYYKYIATLYAKEVLKRTKASSFAMMDGLILTLTIFGASSHLMGSEFCLKRSVTSSSPERLFAVSLQRTGFCRRRI